MGAAEKKQSFESRRRLAGTRLGKYEVGARIGAGGSAAVYLARLTGSASPEEIVALKVVHEHLLDENDFISQFLDEANLLVRLSHPNIVQVHELGREGPTLFLSMEYLHGQPINKFVSALSRRGERIPPELVAWIGARVAEGLAYAHGLKDQRGRPLGLVHRDVSPQNVFITYDGRVKLIDFGIARAARRIAQTTLGRIKGKVSYMAPEQVLGRSFDHRADLFALGATLHEAAAGARLFTGMDEIETIQNVLFAELPDLRARAKDFPEALVKVLHKSLAANPDERFQTGTEMAAAFDEFLASSGAKDLQSRLAALIRDACERDRKEMQTSIDALRAEGRRASVSTLPPSGAEATPGSGWWRRPIWLSAAAALGLAVIGAGLLASRRPAPSANVAIEVITQPDVDARITVGGAALEGKPPRGSRARGADSLEVVVEAPGYETAKLSVVPDRDQSVVIPLTKTPPPPSSAKELTTEGVPAPTRSVAEPALRPPSGHSAASSKPPPPPASVATPSPTPTQSAPLHL